jgi:hypothetical protein
VAGNGNVLGGYLVPSWKANDCWVSDPTVRTFLFSLVNAHSRPVKFKQSSAACAAACSTGTLFLCGVGLSLMTSQASNEQFANGENGTAPNLELDDEYERKYGLAKPNFSLGPGFMSAGGIPGRGRFACEEIEVFAMKPHVQTQQQQKQAKKLSSSSGSCVIV